MPQTEAKYSQFWSELVAVSKKVQSSGKPCRRTTGTFSLDQARRGVKSARVEAAKPANRKIAELRILRDSGKKPY